MGNEDKKSKALHSVRLIPATSCPATGTKKSCRVKFFTQIRNIFSSISFVVVLSILFFFVIFSLLYFALKNEVAWISMQGAPEAIALQNYTGHIAASASYLHFYDGTMTNCSPFAIVDENNNVLHEILTGEMLIILPPEPSEEKKGSEEWPPKGTLWSIPSLNYEGQVNNAQVSTSLPTGRYVVTRNSNQPPLITTIESAASISGNIWYPPMPGVGNEQEIYITLWTGGGNVYLSNELYLGQSDNKYIRIKYAPSEWSSSPDEGFSTPGLKFYISNNKIKTDSLSFTDLSLDGNVSYASGNMNVNDGTLLFTHLNKQTSYALGGALIDLNGNFSIVGKINNNPDIGEKTINITGAATRIELAGVRMMFNPSVFIMDNLGSIISALITVFFSGVLLALFKSKHPYTP